MKFSTAIALIAALAPYHGANSQCSFMNDKNKQRRLGEKEIEERKLQARHHYGRFFDEATLPPFDAANAFRLIEASTKDGYMDESIRNTGFRAGFRMRDRDGNPTSIVVAGRAEAVSIVCLCFCFDF